MTAGPRLPPVLAEDADLVAFDKPAGLLTAPDRWDPERPHLVGLARAVYGPDLANVHRLDAPTSGVLLCARRREALVKLAGQWEGRAVGKLYVALVHGVPPEDAFLIDLPLGDDPRRPGRMVVSRAEGKRGETRVRVVRRWRGWAWLECEPLTGRTHQIRVHLAARGWPIVGDAFYGDGEPLLLSRLKRDYRAKPGEEERPLVPRLGLHAWRLRFAHPSTGAEVALEAPLPKVFGVAQRYLDRFAAA